MQVSEQVAIHAPRQVVWGLVSNIEAAADTISGIDEVEILERPASGLVGLEWRETRTMFGKSARETMWITEAEEGVGYATEARNHGSIYRSRVRLADAPNGTVLTMEFSGEPQTLLARAMSIIFAPLIKRSVRQALSKDALDVKAAAEARTGA